ncbi:MAG: flagellar protein FlaG [Ignavibacteria bacterium]|nr:flagellar protein FlaG [Ignavibacteria bacterium]
MITPIEGTPINELQTSLPEFKTTSRVLESRNEKDLNNAKSIEKGLDNLNKFVKTISQVDTNQQSKKPVDFDKIARKLEEIIGEENLMVEFTRDKETKKLIFKLINQETKEVVQQIPPDVALQIARYVAAILEDKNVANAKV